MRLRDQHFCESLIRRTAGAGKLTDEVLTDTALDAYSFVNRPAALREAREKLRKPEIQERIAEVYRSCDFDVLDAVEWHVKHIRGEIEERIVTTDSEGRTTTTVRPGPSWPALAAYERMTLPQPSGRGR